MLIQQTLYSQLEAGGSLFAGLGMTDGGIVSQSGESGSLPDSDEAYDLLFKVRCCERRPVFVAGGQCL